MKTILFTAAILMIGASIYGFVDYRKNSHKKEFKKLYTQPVITPQPDQPVQPVKEEVKGAVTETKNAVQEAKNPANQTVATGKKKQAKKSAVKKRKLDHRIFSRAPLDDEYLEEEAPKDENKPDFR